MRKTVTKWSIIVVLLLYVVIMFFWSNAQAAQNTCKGIDVEIRSTGNTAPLSSQSVLEVLGNYPRKIEGSPINTINTLDIADYLRKYNNFESVECLITGQGQLRVIIVPMIPEFRVYDGDKTYYVNKDGKTMQATYNFFVDVPVVCGNFNKNFRPESLLPVIRFIKNDKMLSELTGMVIARDKDNILLVPRIKGHVINLGDVSRLEEKRNAIFTAYKEIIPHKGWETYDTISVKFKGQIVATRRDKTPRYPVPEITDEEDLEESALLTGTGEQAEPQNQTQNQPQNEPQQAEE